MSDEKKYTGMPPYAPGTHVRESDIQNKLIAYAWWEPEVQYSWSVGHAMSKFLMGLKAGKIFGIHCKRCERVLVPPRMFCEHCYGPTEEWIELPDTGIIETFSISYLDPNARRIEDPILVGVVDLDGAPPHSPKCSGAAARVLDCAESAHLVRKTILSHFPPQGHAAILEHTIRRCYSHNR